MRRRLLIIYLGLLLFSWGWQALTPDDRIEVEGESVTLPDQTLIGWRSFGDTSATKKVVFLHGSPMAGSSMIGLAQALINERPDTHILIPDFPGFGLSRQPLDDYSFASHAVAISDWLDLLNINEADLVAYSMGGGVALSLYNDDPGKVRSLVLLSSIGVQELELLGSYEWNNAIHRFQHGLIVAADWLIPHFGYFDDALLGQSYSRNFLDSDQRPLRAVLERFGPPMLIVHGRADSLVPFAAALEHQRIVPQAESLFVPGGHGVLFGEPAMLAAAIADFLDRVSSNVVLTRADATPARIAAAEQSFDRTTLPSVKGLALILIGLSIIILSYLSEDLACIVAGLLAAGGAITLLEGVVFAFIGIYTGDMLVYLSGRWARRGKERWFRKMQSARMAQASRWFEKHGALAVVGARFVPGTRFPVFLSAGISRMRFGLFALLLLGSALVWTPALTSLAWWGGERTLAHLDWFREHALLGGALIAGGLIFVLKVIPLIASRNARRLAWGRWQRRLNWEFWSPWFVYGPLLPWFIWLAIRYRGATVFTAANPAMPAGGLIDESKHEILAQIDHPAIPPWLHERDPGSSAAFERLETWRLDNGLQYPLVIKPERGERGSGVVFARDAESAQNHLAACQEAQIIQPFVSGPEFGVFYYRLPGSDVGEIFAITEKRPLQLLGDGKRSLRQLIIDHDRAVIQAGVHFARHRQLLNDVIADGAHFQLVELGTHSRGCLFLDGSRLITEPLLERIDEISRAYPGFYFGRYDLKAPDEEALARGEHLKVLELNGVSSEATSIYDPKNSIIDAWKVLGRQWELAFRIGAMNRSRRRPVDTPLALIGRLWAARTRRKY